MIHQPQAAAKMMTVLVAGTMAAMNRKIQTQLTNLTNLMILMILMILMNQMIMRRRESPAKIDLGF